MDPPPQTVASNSDRINARLRSPSEIGTLLSVLVPGSMHRRRRNAHVRPNSSAVVAGGRPCIRRSASWHGARFTSSLPDRGIGSCGRTAAASSGTTRRGRRRLPWGASSRDGTGPSSSCSTSRATSPAARGRPGAGSAVWSGGDAATATACCSWVRPAGSDPRSAPNCMGPVATPAIASVQLSSLLVEQVDGERFPVVPCGASQILDGLLGTVDGCQSIRSKHSMVGVVVCVVSVLLQRHEHLGARNDGRRKPRFRTASHAPFASPCWSER